MTEQTRYQYLERERVGVITRPTGEEMRIANITRAQFDQLTARHRRKAATDARGADPALLTRDDCGRCGF